MQKQNDSRFATDSIPHLILSLSTPAIAAQLINALYNVVDRIYIGRIPEVGTLAFTGVSVTFPIIMIVSAFAALIGYGGAPLASIRMGEGKLEEAEQMLGNCFAMLCTVSVLLTTILFLFQTPLLLLFGASADTLPFAQGYLNIYLWGTLGVQISLGMNSFISAQGFAKTAMGTVCIGAALNILLDPILIFGFGMGVRGAALATILSQMVSAVWVLKFLLSERGKLRLQRKYLRIRPAIAASALALGLSPFIMQSTESLVQISFNKSLQAYGGDLYVGAMGIMSSIMQFFMMPIQGFAQGAQPIISYNYGAQNFSRVKAAIRYMTIFCVGGATLFWIITIFFPAIPVRLFSNDPAVVTLACSTMRIFFLGMLLMGFQMAFQQSFIALGQAKVSILIAVLRKLVLLIPLVLLLPQIISPKTMAVIIAEPIADAIAATTCCILFAIKYKKLLCQPPKNERETDSTT